MATFDTDPESRTMADPFKGGTKLLTEDEMSAEDPAFRAKYPGVASMYKAKNPWHPDEGNIGLNIGRSLRESFNNVTGSKWLDQANDGPWQGALAYGAPAAALGAVGGLGLGMWRHFTAPDDERSTIGTALKTSLLGALGGAAVGAYSHHVRKEAGYNDGSTLSAVINAIRSSGMGVSEQQTLMSQLTGMSQQQLRDLMMLLSTAGGAAAGSIAVRYIAGKSLINGALGAAVGGLIANKMSDSFTRPAPSNAGKGFYGYNAHTW